MKTIKINNALLKVAVAKSESEQKKGLMHIKGLSCNHGMLFQYSKEQFLSFWMKNTKIPLSIAFINKDLEIVQIEDMKPLDEKPVKSSQKVMWALEANKGWFENNNVSLGDKVILTPEKLINIKIVKFPPEAQALAKKIEDTLSKMVSKTVKAMAGPNKDINSFNIDVSEGIMKITKSEIEKIIKEEVNAALKEQSTAEAVCNVNKNNSELARQYADDIEVIDADELEGLFVKLGCVKFVKDIVNGIVRAKQDSTVRYMALANYMEKNQITTGEIRHLTKTKVPSKK